MRWRYGDAVPPAPTFENLCKFKSGPFPHEPLKDAYPAVYEQLCLFYRQNPLPR